MSIAEVEAAINLVLPLVRRSPDLNEEDTRRHHVQLASYGEGATDLSLVLTNGEYWNVRHVAHDGLRTEERPIRLHSRRVPESAERLHNALSVDVRY